MDTLDRRYTQASIATADNLKSIAESASARSMSRLSLPEVDAVVEQVAKILPAGNVPGMILSGLTRLTGGRNVSQKTVKRDVNSLFKGVAQTLDAAVYGTFFAGPAAVIWGYQQLLRLSGKSPEDAFPQGVWQFYVDYAMREDTARHTNETHGFDSLLNRKQIRLDATDRITAWVMAAINCLHQYNALLANEWRERVYSSQLAQITKDEFEAVDYARLYREWEKQRPYGRGPDTLSNETYPDYRQRKFDEFLAHKTNALRSGLRDVWATEIRQAEAKDLPAYQQQMSIMAYLDSGTYGETRVPIQLEDAYVGVIHQGSYFLIPACEPGTARPAQIHNVRSKVAALLANPSSQTPPLTPLAEIKRASWPDLRQDLSQELVDTLDKLKLAPILINFDVQPARFPLCDLRHAERGIGDHALTLFDTGATMVFDLSHVFFDGAWGAALSEILTREAQFWARHLGEVNEQPSLCPKQQPVPLDFRFITSDLGLVKKAPRVTAEVSAETEIVDLKAMLKLRKLMKQRNDLLRLTVNDLLILYRAIHSASYQPHPALINELKNLTEERETRQAARAALEAIKESQKANPAIAMPVDASRQNPKDRLHPVTVDVPLNDLDLLNLHKQTLAALNAYTCAKADRSRAYAEFDELQRLYLATLAGFGLVLSKAKTIAGMGQSFSVGTIKLLAYMPVPLQRMLEKVPDNFEMLNDIIRGREVFSNVGAVASTSTLTRFISAKDDSDKKTLVWATMTDANGVMRVTLRDFRPHVGMLKSIGRKDLAAKMSQDYLETYAHGLNNFIKDLQSIAQSTHKTHPKRPGA